jgi:hypothetical protein
MGAYKGQGSWHPSAAEQNRLLTLDASITSLEETQQRTSLTALLSLFRAQKNALRYAVDKVRRYLGSQIQMVRENRGLERPTATAEIASFHNG